MSSDVWLYDGESALRRSAMLEPDGATFRLIVDGRTTDPIAFADLIRRDDADRLASFTRARVPGWRLILPAGIPADLAARLPAERRYGGIIDRIGLWPATAGFAALAAVAIVAFLNTPPLVARAIPASVEKRLGDLMIGDFGRKGCDTPAGDAALAALVDRVDPHDPSLEVSVVKLPIVNAVTLPGGRIVLFDGLVQAAASPDEVAGVIGHEIGHVRHRDVMESLIRQLGLSVLLGGLDGNVANYTNALLATSYSRNAESRADTFAIELLKEAQVSPKATATFFTRLGGKDARTERMFAYLASHPVSADRAKRFADSAAATSYRPALDAGQWRALRAMCAKTKEEEGWRF